MLDSKEHGLSSPSLVPVNSKHELTLHSRDKLTHEDKPELSPYFKASFKSSQVGTLDTVLEFQKRYPRITNHFVKAQRMGLAPELSLA